MFYRVRCNSCKVCIEVPNKKEALKARVKHRRENACDLGQELSTNVVIYKVNPLNIQLPEQPAMQSVDKLFITWDQQEAVNKREKADKTLLQQEIAEEEAAEEERVQKEKKQFVTGYGLLK